jgi:DHA3 family tetracycline resistance protein-like MFS transporter
MRIQVLAPLRHRDYRLLAVGSFVSWLGDGFFLASIALQVYALQDAPSAMSVVGAIVALSQVTMLIAGGWAADRFSRRRLLIAADLARAVAVGLLGVLSVTDRLQMWHVWALVALLGISNAFYNPTSTAFLPNLLPESDLARGNALFGAARPLMNRLLGPALGGLLVSLAGPGPAFLLDAGTFVFSAVLIALIRTRQQPVPRAEAGSMLSGLSEGWRFVRSRRWCWGWLVASALASFGFIGPFEVLVPYLLRFDPTLGLSEAQAARTLGLVLAAGGVGSIAMSVAVGQLELPRRLLTAMYIAEAGGVALIAVFGLMTSAWHAVAAGLGIYALFAFTDIGWPTLLQRAVPNHLLGRVSSIDWLVALGLAPLSLLLAGPLAERYGAREVLIGGAALGTAALLAMFSLPGVRDEGGDTADVTDVTEGELTLR